MKKNLNYYSDSRRLWQKILPNLFYGLSIILFVFVINNSGELLFAAICELSTLLVIGSIDLYSRLSNRIKFTLGDELYIHCNAFEEYQIPYNDISSIKSFPKAFEVNIAMGQIYISFKGFDRPKEFIKELNSKITDHKNNSKKII